MNKLRILTPKERKLVARLKEIKTDADFDKLTIAEIEANPLLLGAGSDLPSLAKKRKVRYCPVIGPIETLEVVHSVPQATRLTPKSQTKVEG